MSLDLVRASRERMEDAFSASRLPTDSPLGASQIPKDEKTNKVALAAIEEVNSPVADGYDSEDSVLSTDLCDSLDMAENLYKAGLNKGDIADIVEADHLASSGYERCAKNEVLAKKAVAKDDIRLLRRAVKQMSGPDLDHLKNRLNGYLYYVEKAKTALEALGHESD